MYCTFTVILILLWFGSFRIFFTEESTELKVVNWVIRYRVAIGVARGLAYLHHGCDPSIIHGDISSTNILLDHHFEPHISDFGLAKLLDSSDTHITATVGGTFGYIAPGTSCLWQISNYLSTNCLLDLLVIIALITKYESSFWKLWSLKSSWMHELIYKMELLNGFGCSNTKI
jgi:serine/threonine protein kinase